MGLEKNYPDLPVLEEVGMPVLDDDSIPADEEQQRDKPQEEI
jgi:hypothetical protein